MRVTFVLPAPVRVPMGGAYVVYQHAAGLAALGHDVTVLAPARIGALGWLRQPAVRLRDLWQGIAPAAYYDAPGVRTVEVEALEEAPASHAVIATGIQTFPFVSSLPQSAGVKVSFVQGEETFVQPDARASWAIPVPVIACSRWLAAEVAAAGGHVLGVAPNAPNPNVVDGDVPVSPRAPSVLALYHRHPVKGPDLLKTAYGILRDARPDLPLRGFSARRPSHRLPPGTEVHVRPDVRTLKRLYAQTSIFLHTSRSEGWGLTPMEAAANGCAIVATPSRGVNEFLEPGRSMRQTAASGEALAEAVLDLLADEATRDRLAKAGRRDASRFSWGESTVRFESFLNQAVAAG